jgi:hypothetical protein
MQHMTPEQDAWVSYLEPRVGGDTAEIRGSSSPVPGVIERLITEQSTAAGGRARDIAYALAVFGKDYQKNRDFLLLLLNTCLQKPQGSPEDDGCDYQLLDYLVNLYWRGDKSLLQPLLQIADTRRGALGFIGDFYADILERQPAQAMQGLQKLDAQRQETVCELAGEEIRGRHFQKVEHSLRTSGKRVANRCLEQIRAQRAQFASP